MDGASRGRIAGHHHHLDVLLFNQLAQDGARPPGHIVVTPLAIRRMRGVGEVDEIFSRQLGAQRLEDAQAADAAVEYAYRIQAAATGMFLNSPLAIFFCHSAGPVMWALVPPASTATV